MLNLLKKFNDSGRVSLIYGVCFAYCTLIIPLGALGLFIITNENSSGWSLLGGLWLISLSVGCAIKTFPAIIKDFNCPTIGNSSPNNMWLPIMLTALASLFIYAEYGKYGDRVNQFIAAMPATVVTTVLPFTAEVFESIETLHIKELEQYK